jgi:hypothetical protein
MLLNWLHEKGWFQPLSNLETHNVGKSSRIRRRPEISAAGWA